jgi:predicted nucleotidyltransferase
MLDKRTVREIAVKYVEEVRKFLNPNAIILFGSYVNGTPDKNSDIDIAVIVSDFQGDWLGVASRLCGIKWDMRFTDIKPHLLDDTHDPSGFVEHVIKTGEVIYKAA